jgi:hypothetical protein
MKNLIFIFIFGVMLTSSAQNNLINKSNSLLNYSYPNNWSESPYQKVNGNITYGCQTFDLGETAEFSVIEIPNDSKIINAHNLSKDEIQNLVFNLFSPTSNFKIIENRNIAGLNSKYIKADAVTSKGLQLTTILHLTYFKNKILIIQGIYTTKDENKYLSILNAIFKSVKKI